MANGTELRGIALEILLEITQEKEYSHLAIRNALNKGPCSLQRSGKTGTEKRILQPEGICQRRNA